MKLLGVVFAGAKVGLREVGIVPGCALWTYQFHFRGHLLLLSLLITGVCGIFSWPWIGGGHFLQLGPQRI